MMKPRTVLFGTVLVTSLCLFPSLLHTGIMYLGDPHPHFYSRFASTMANIGDINQDDVPDGQPRPSRL